MMKRCNYILYFVLAIMLPLVSCHKNVYDDDIYGNRNKVTKTTKTTKTTKNTKKSTTNASSQVPDDWRTLDIKLERGDNKALYREVKEWLGTPYKYAAMQKGVGSDCSGFVFQIYKSVYNKAIERNSARIFMHNCKEISRDQLREGDLVFFNGGKRGRITHVGLYLKQGYFVHASSSRGVMVSSLNQHYFISHFECAGRIR